VPFKILKPTLWFFGFAYAVWVIIASLQEHAVPSIRIDGSSTVFPITEAAAEEFQLTRQGDVRITVGISGTGGGFKKFCRGETDIQDASRPITPAEREACRRNGIAFHELPVAYDAMTIVVSRSNTWAESITLRELKQIWEPAAQQVVTRWAQVRPEWPDLPLQLYGAGSDSGTFDYFTEAVVGRAKASRGDYTASEDDNTLVQGIARNRQALGYIPFGYYEHNQHLLRAVPVDSGAGPLAPSRSAVEGGVYHPLSRPLLLYVNRESARRREVKEFVLSYLNAAASLAQEVGFVSLPTEVYAVAVQQFQAGRLGTVFASQQPTGRPLSELIQLNAEL
jgi:phosphate transport system substrate-binding protein